MGTHDKYNEIQKLSEEAFRRLTGVKRSTFLEMVRIVKEAATQKVKHGGRPRKQTIQDQVLMCLEYLREYRTYFHLSKSYGGSESNCYRTCRFVEEILVRSQTFRLPGRKAPLASQMQYEVVLIDATESPIERPKKRESVIRNPSGIVKTGRSDTTRGRRNGTPSRHK